MRLGVQLTEAMDARLQRAADGIGVAKSTVIAFVVGQYLNTVESMQGGLIDLAKQEIARSVRSEGPKDEA